MPYIMDFGTSLVYFLILMIMVFPAVSVILFSVAQYCRIKPKKDDFKKCVNKDSRR